MKLEINGGAATSIMHGGLQDMPGSRLNTDLPVRSNISTKDGSDKPKEDGIDIKIKPDNLFKFKKPEDRNATRERQAQWIDKKGQRAVMTRIPPDTIY